MDEITRAVGKLEGRFDGLEQRLDERFAALGASLEKHVKEDGDVEKRVADLEQARWRAHGFIAAVSAIVSVFASLVVKRIA